MRQIGIDGSLGSMSATLRLTLNVDRVRIDLESTLEVFVGRTAALLERAWHVNGVVTAETGFLFPQGARFKLTPLSRAAGTRTFQIFDLGAAALPRPWHGATLALHEAKDLAPSRVCREKFPHLQLKRFSRNEPSDEDRTRFSDTARAIDDVGSNLCPELSGPFKVNGVTERLIIRLGVDFIQEGRDSLPLMVIKVALGSPLFQGGMAHADPD